MSASSFSSAARSVANSRRSIARSAFSVSAWELTDTYSPAAIERAPATRPATPARTIWWREEPAAATPTTRLAVDRIPSSAPSTAARNHPILSLRCRSACLIQFLFSLLRKLKQQPDQNFGGKPFIAQRELMFSCMFSRTRGQVLYAGPHLQL